MIFFPGKKIVDTPETIGLQYEDVYLVTDDNIRVHGWYVPHADAKATVLFFHGNAGNISHRLDSISIFHELDLSVFIIGLPRLRQKRRASVRARDIPGRAGCLGLPGR